MKYFAAFLGLVIALTSLQARAQATPDDQYISIYGLIQQADSLQAAGQTRQALNEYTQAAQQLQQFQKVFPGWNPRIVNFRLNYLSQKIGGMTATMPATSSNTPPTTVNAAPAPTPATATTATSTGAATDTDALRAQVQNLQSENATLQAKLREALSAQPVATPDAQELAMAQQQVKSLLKENEMLRTGAEQQKTSKPVSNAKEVKQLQMALAEAKQKLEEQTTRANKLAMENQRLQSLAKNSEAMEALREENAMLKKQVARLQANSPGDANVELAKLRAQVAELQSDADVQYLEKIALEKRLQSPSSETSAAQTGEEMSATHYATNSEAAATETNAPETVATVATSEANPTESAETNAVTEAKPVSQLPEGSAALVAEAQNYFAAHEYDKAEADYRQILQREPDNGVALANLAAIEMEENKLPEAEQHLQAALAKSPDDGYDLSIYGYLQFREHKFDEALDTLNRATKADPRNPQVQNYLGVTLSHKGRQAEAEQALLKAVELDPNYAAAHNNLAVVYINENPPKVELARWHYQKAIDAGQPRNSDLEKLLAQKGAPVAAQ